MRYEHMTESLRIMTMQHRCDMARLYRAVRKDSPEMARLLFRRQQAAQSALIAHMVRGGLDKVLEELNAL